MLCRVSSNVHTNVSRFMLFYKFYFNTYKNSNVPQLCNQFANNEQVALRFSLGSWEKTRSKMCFR